MVRYEVFVLRNCQVGRGFISRYGVIVTANETRAGRRPPAVPAVPRSSPPKHRSTTFPTRSSSAKPPSSDANAGFPTGTSSGDSEARTRAGLLCNAPQCRDAALPAPHTAQPPGRRLRCAPTLLARRRARPTPHGRGPQRHLPLLPYERRRTESPAGPPCPPGASLTPVPNGSSPPRRFSRAGGEGRLLVAAFTARSALHSQRAAAAERPAPRAAGSGGALLTWAAGRESQPRTSENGQLLPRGRPVLQSFIPRSVPADAAVLASQPQLHPHASEQPLSHLRHRRSPPGCAAPRAGPGGTARSTRLRPARTEQDRAAQARQLLVPALIIRNRGRVKRRVAKEQLLREVRSSNVRQIKPARDQVLSNTRTSRTEQSQASRRRNFGGFEKRGGNLSDKSCYSGGEQSSAERFPASRAPVSFILFHITNIKL